MTVDVVQFIHQKVLFNFLIGHMLLERHKAPFKLQPTRIDSFSITIEYHMHNVRGRHHSNAAERPVMQLICNANATTDVDIKAMIYLLLSLWLFVTVVLFL